MDQREDVTAHIKERADIVQVIGEQVDLKKSGARFLGLCPFHGEKTPSFSVHPGQQFFHCFGCGESGDVFSFIMKYQNVDFPEALRILAEKYHVELPKRRQSKEEEARIRRRKALFAVSNKASEVFSRYLQENRGGETARVYLEKRGVAREIIESYRIGYAPAVEVEGWNFLGSKLSGQEKDAAIEAGLLVKKENGTTYDRFRDRIVFPVLDISGQVCGFGGRIVGEGKPKYLNSPESVIFNKGRLLLGLYQQKDQIRKQNKAVLVEGNFDLISLVAHGCSNVVAPLGTALTREQLRLLKRFCEEATLLFDGDEAGRKAAERSVPLFLAEQLAGKVALLPKGHDPDTFVQDHGSSAVHKLVEDAEELPEFLLERLIEEYGLGLDGKRRIVDKLGPLINTAVSPLQRSVVISHFADRLGLPPQELEKHLKEPAREVEREEPVVIRPPAEPAVLPLSMAQKQLVEYMVLNPVNFKVLKENGIRDCLVGTIGEILYLELEGLLQTRSEAEPEELLTLLPEGQERRFVANLLGETAKIATGADGDGQEEELADLVKYLQRNNLKKYSETLSERLQQAQAEGNHELVLKLMSEQVELNRKIHGVEVGG